MEMVSADYGDAYTFPAALTDFPGFEDRTYGNDTAAHIAWEAERGPVSLMVEAVKPSEREDDFYPRYTLYDREDDEIGEFLDDAETVSELWRMLESNKALPEGFRRPRHISTLPRGTVIEGDWVVVTTRDGEDRVFGGDEYPHVPQGATRVKVHAWGVREPSGKWSLHKDEAAAKRHYQKLRRTADTRFQWAETFEQEVRDALNRNLSVSPDLVDVAAQSSFLYPMRYTRRAADPFRVYILSETGIGDPFNDRRVLEGFDKAVDELEQRPDIEEAGWESVNPGLQYFWAKPIFSG